MRRNKAVADSKPDVPTDDDDSESFSGLAGSLGQKCHDAGRRRRVGASFQKVAHLLPYACPGQGPQQRLDYDYPGQGRDKASWCSSAVAARSTAVTLARCPPSFIPPSLQQADGRPQNGGWS